MCNKLFLSHSSEDLRIVTAFVNFMYKVGLTEEILYARQYLKLKFL